MVVEQVELIKTLSGCKEKNEEREGKNLRNVAKNGITVLSDG